MQANKVTVFLPTNKTITYVVDEQPSIHDEYCDKGTVMRITPYITEQHVRVEFKNSSVHYYGIPFIAEFS